jgi:hypothetical protein
MKRGAEVPNAWRNEIEEWCSREIELFEQPPGSHRLSQHQRWGKEDTVGEAKKSNLPRLITLFIAFVGCVVTVLPLLFSVGANPVPFILVGSGVAVIALALFLFFSI